LANAAEQRMSVTNRVFTWKPPGSSTLPETSWL
jgi:hypothetical protein